MVRALQAAKRRSHLVLAPIAAHDLRVAPTRLVWEQERPAQQGALPVPPSRREEPGGQPRQSRVRAHVDLEHFHQVSRLQGAGDRVADPCHWGPLAAPQTSPC